VSAMLGGFLAVFLWGAARRHGNGERASGPPIPLAPDIAQPR
jgi:hypothetical protein